MVVDDAPAAHQRHTSGTHVITSVTGAAPHGHNPKHHKPSRPLYSYIGGEEFAYAGAGVDDEGYDYASDKDAGLDGEGAFLFV